VMERLQSLRRHSDAVPERGTGSISMVDLS
jgi:hypothetical protein